MLACAIGDANETRKFSLPAPPRSPWPPTHPCGPLSTPGTLPCFYELHLPICKANAQGVLNPYSKKGQVGVLYKLATRRLPLSLRLLPHFAHPYYFQGRRRLVARWRSHEASPGFWRLSVFGALRSGAETCRRATAAIRLRSRRCRVRLFRVHHHRSRERNRRRAQKRILRARCSTLTPCPT